jgi:hypothetical protein
MMADNNMFKGFAVGSTNNGRDRKRIWNRNRMVVVWGERQRGFKAANLIQTVFTYLINDRL